MLQRFFLAAVLALAAHTTGATVREEPVTYSDGTTTMKGVVVYDDASTGRRPGIVLVHEWWGITPHLRAEARRLAAAGYTALLADMYGDGRTADEPKTAGELSASVRKNPVAMKSRFEAAMQTLAHHATVDDSRIAAIGFCFGGSVVLDMARAGENLAAVVAFHAAPLDPAAGPAEPGKFRGKMLVLQGGDDPFVKPDSIERFKKEMDAAKIDYRYVSYPGAKHAFTNPDATAKGKEFNLPLAYDAHADQAAKAEASRLLAIVVKS